jgi:toxin ParE1/3/4
MTRLVLTDNAKADTAEILDYLAREAGARVAEDFGRRFRAAIERLADLPEIGAPRSRLGPNIRIAVVYPYLLIYRYTRQDETLTLLRILHGRRNITRDLLRG